MPEWLGETSWKTAYFGLQVLRGQAVSEDNYAFTDADRVLIDKLLNQIFIHQHTGEGALTNPLNEATPSETVTLEQTVTGGAIPAGVLMCYRVSFYDETGETVASEEQTIATLSPVADPSYPSVETATTGGTLAPGQYFYAVSAVKGNGETYPSSPAAIVVPTTTSTNKNTLTLPSPPSGATHWKIYRKIGESSYYYLTQITVATFTWEDTGIANGAEGLPQENNTNSENKVTITLSGYPVGATGYRIYRSIISGYYPSYNLLVDQTIGATPDLIQEDIYQTPEYGVPLDASGTYGAPPEVNLASEVIGHLLTSHITPLDANIDFAKYQALQFVVHKATSAPLTPVEGQVWEDTTTNKLYIYLNAEWRLVFTSNVNFYQWASPSFIVPGSLWDDSLATPTIKVCNITQKPAGNLTIIEVHAHVKTAPVAAATPISLGVRIDIKKDGSSIFINDAAKPIILNGQYDGYSTTIQTTALVKNSNLTMVIDTVDDIHTAADLETFVRCKQYLLVE